MGGLLIIYTVSGGAKAVAHTQKLQLIIVIIGMLITGYLIVHLMPANIGFIDALAYWRQKRQDEYYYFRKNRIGLTGKINTIYGVA